METSRSAAYTRQVVFIPAIISLSLFLSINYIIRPAVRRYRERYEQYLPLHSISGSLVQHTKSLKDRIGDKIMAYILPRFHISRRGSIDNGEELYFGNEEGEDMVGFEADIADIERRREQLRREVGNMEGAREGPEDYGEPR